MKRRNRANGTLRAWFPTRAEAETSAADPTNTAYHGDIPVLCLKPGCDGWHLRVSRRVYLKQFRFLPLLLPHRTGHGGCDSR